MKSQKWGFAVVLMLGVCLLSFHLSGSGPGQPPFDQKAIMDVMEVDQSLISRFPDVKLRENMKGSLAHQVVVDFDAMKLEFEGNNLTALAELLGRRGVFLTTPKFEKIRGAEIALFWQGKGEVTLGVVPVHLHISGAINPQLVPYSAFADQGITIEQWEKNAIKYDAVAVLIFEFHIVSKTNGAASHNDTGLGVATYLHKTGCPWG